MPSQIQRIVFASLVVLGSFAAPEAHATGDYRLVGYVAGWEKQPRIDVAKLTAVNFAFAHIDSGGHAVLDQAGSDEALTEMRALKAHNANLKILISIGGWGADGFSDAAADEGARRVFAQSVVDMLERASADGVDLDWEYPGLPGPGIKHRDADRRNFTLLLAALRQRLSALAQSNRRAHDDPYLLTAALADGEFVAHIELGRIGAYLDWINLMTYDFHNSLTPTTGHHSALTRSATSAPGERSVEAAVAQFLAAGVPARKLVLGVPFYGRAFADVDPHNDGLDQPFARYAGDHPWPQLVADFIDRNGYVRHWDATAKEPYLWNAQEHVFVSYDDPQSLAIKAAYVKAKHLGGMMYWEQSQDPDGQLLDVLATGLKTSP